MFNTHQVNLAVNLESVKLVFFTTDDHNFLELRGLVVGNSGVFR